MKRLGWLWLWAGSGLLAGCGTVNPYLNDAAQMSRLKQRAFEALKRGVGFDALASVRAQAIESLQDEAPIKGLPWMRTGLSDDHPAVRFAACMSLGTLQDAGSREAMKGLLKDDNASVRAAAIFALHRLGDTSHTAELASLLREHPEPAVRRNAALVLGRLGEPGAIALLAGVVGSKDDGLHIQALEGMVWLGSPEAIQQMIFVSQSGNGPEEVLALNALAQRRDTRFKKLMQRKLADSLYRETRLAAANGLGEMGLADGLSEALAGIDFDKPKAGLENDPPENQRMRIRQMAAAALGAIGDPAALPALADRLEDNRDARVQIAAARAILAIINRRERETLPFSGMARANKS